MYHVVSVGKLSETQKSRLRNGHATRIKKGNGNKLHLTAEQIKKLESAHKKGRGFTLTMHPEQAEKHGSGFFGDIASKLKQLAIKHKDIINPLINGAKGTLKQGIAKLASTAQDKVENLIQPIEGGSVKRRRGRPKGKGIVGDVLKGIIGFTGLGVKPKRGTKKTTTKKAPKKTTKKTTTRKSKKIGKEILKAVAPALIHAAVGAAKKKTSGAGTKKRRVGRPRKSGGALFPA